MTESSTSVTRVHTRESVTTTTLAESTPDRPNAVRASAVYGDARSVFNSNVVLSAPGVAVGHWRDAAGAEVRVAEMAVTMLPKTINRHVGR